MIKTFFKHDLFGIGEVIIMVLLLLPGKLTAQVFSASQVKEDLNFLAHSIEQYNPALYLYNPRFKTHSDDLINTVSDSMSLVSYFGLVSQLAAYSNEGHFGVGGWNDTVHKGFLNNTYKYFPLSVKVLSGEVFVWQSYTGDQRLKKGDKIISINDRKTAKIIKEMYRHIPSDGYIETYLQQQLTIGFPWMYYLYMEQPEQFSITYESFLTGDKETVVIDALTRSEMGANFKKNASVEEKTETVKTENGIYSFEIEGSQAMLKLKSFNRALMKKQKIKPKNLYKKLFKDLKEQNVAHLIVDLRNNYGGRNEFADDIIPYIMKNSVKEVFKTTVSWQGKEKQYKTSATSKWVFKGKIWVLVNGRTYSAASSLARYFKEYGDAIVIGEETGTRYEGFAAGSQQTIILPNSGINIYIPRYHIKHPLSKKQQTHNKGLVPNFIVTYSIEDLLNERDLEMDHAKKLIGNKN